MVGKFTYFIAQFLSNNIYQAIIMFSTQFYPRHNYFITQLLLSNIHFADKV